MNKRVFIASPPETVALRLQERFGGLTGTVTDAQKLAVPGATVTATNKQTGASRSTVTGADGTFLFPDLDPGRYAVTIELQGFQKNTIDDLHWMLLRFKSTPPPAFCRTPPHERRGVNARCALV